MGAEFEINTFSDIESKIEKAPSIQEKISNLKVNLETRGKHGDLVKNISGIELEKTNYLARINEAAITCNNHKEEFLEGCSENFNLQFA